MFAFLKTRPLLLIIIDANIMRLIVVFKTGENYQLIEQREIIHPLSPDILSLKSTLFLPTLPELLSKYDCKKVLVSLPSDWARYQSLSFSRELSQAELTESILLEVEHQHFNTPDYYIDFTISSMDDTNHPNAQYYVLLATLLKKNIAPLLSVLHNHGLTPSLITTHRFLFAHLNMAEIGNSEAQEPHRINFLPWRLLKTERTKKIIYSVLIFSALILIACSVAWRIQLNHEIKNERQQLVHLESDYKQNEQTYLTTLEQNKKNEEVARQSDELQSLNSRRYFLLKAFNVFSEKLPSDLYLTALSQQNGIFKIAGRASNHSAITQLVSALSATPEFKLAQIEFVKKTLDHEQLEFEIQVPELNVTKED